MNWEFWLTKLSWSERYLVNLIFPDQIRVKDLSQRYDLFKLVSAAKKRVVKAGFRDVCDRCGGTGRMPFPQVYQGICFKCDGKGCYPPTLTKEFREKLEAHFQKVDLSKVEEVAV